MRCAGTWWFPMVVAGLSAVNIFTFLLSAVNTGLFLAAVIAQPSRRWSTAAMNAFGVACGAAVLLVLVHVQGLTRVTETFPGLSGSDSWERTRELCERWGILGATVFSAMPIVVHPMLLLGAALGMQSWTLVLAVLGGRTIKYSLMAQCAVMAPSSLKYFGISESLLESIKASAAAIPRVPSLENLKASAAAIPRVPSLESIKASAAAIPDTIEKIVSPRSRGTGKRPPAVADCWVRGAHCMMNGECQHL